MNGFADLSTREVEFVGRLEIHPEVRRHAEILAEAQGGVRNHAPFAGKKLIEAVRRHFDNAG